MLEKNSHATQTSAKFEQLNQNSNCINKTFELSVDHSSGQHFSNDKLIRWNDATDRSSLRESVRIRSFSGPYFPAFGLTIERYSVSLQIQSNAGKYRPEKLQIRALFTQCIFCQQSYCSATTFAVPIFTLPTNYRVRREARFP